MVSLKTHFFEAIRQLTISKLRAFLAVLGILVGTASVVAMVSIGQLAEHQILSQFTKMGINLLSVSTYSNSFGTQQQANPHAHLSIKTANALVHSSQNIALVAPYFGSYGGIVYRGKSMQGSAVGITPSMVDIAKLQLLKGRFLSYLDVHSYFCVIGYDLYQAMKTRGFTDPIGSQIKSGSTIFTIVGVMKKWPTNFFFNTDFNHAILVPLNIAMSLQKNAVISNLAIKIRDTNLMATTQSVIKTYIKAHTIKQNVSIRSPKSIIDSMKKSSETMTLLLGLIGSISLLVGGIGVMNIMLVSVTERHKEIGIRLAIGAKQRDIQLQFLVEAVVLSVFGGVAGMLLGVLATWIVSIVSHWQFAVFFLPPLIGCLVSVLVGIFFGFYPAWKAAKLDPIQTLRA